MLDVLEDRTLPSMTNWTGLGFGGNWSDKNNWDNGPPGLGDTAVFSGGGGSPTVDVPFDIDGIIMAPSWHGVLHVSHNLSMSGASAWSGGDVSVGNGIQWTNNGTLTISVPAGGLILSGSGVLVNTNTIVETGPGSLLLVPSGTGIDNQAGALYDLQADTPGINNTGIGQFTNEGTLQKSQGTSSGTSTIHSFLTDTNGTIHVATGTLIMNVASINFGSSYNGTTFSVDGTLDLTGTGGGSVYASGTLTGTGSGTVRLAGSSLAAGSGGAILNFDPGMFQWTGGKVDGNTNGLTVAAGSSLTLAGSAAKTESGALTNNGTITQTYSGNLVFNGTLNNQAGALYDLQSDAGLSDTFGRITNAGTFRKSGGTGVSNLGTDFDNPGGTIDVETGTLTMHNAGFPPPGTYGDGSTFVVAGGATLDLAGGNKALVAGTLTGSGSGTVRLSGGTLAAAAGGATFALPSGMFQWTGGTLDANTNGLTIAAGSSLTLAGSATKTETGALTNDGTITQTDSGNLVFNGTLSNQAVALYDLQSDASLSDTAGRITNAGTFRKSGGTAVSNIGDYFDNTGGTIEVQTGTLNMRNGGPQPGTYGDGSNFVVAGGATLDLTGGFGNVFVTGTLTGSGNGTVRLSSGALGAAAGGATFNFPSGMFQWTGGTLDANTNGLTIAVGSFFSLSGAATKKLGGTLTNQGTMVQTDTGLLELGSGTVNNQDGAVYDLQSDAGLDSNNGGPFVNNGLFRKSGGTNTSTITSYFNNSGTVEARSGTLAINFVTAQITGTTLNGGTWNVFDTATLTLNGGVALNTNNGNITLSGASPAFSNITNLAANGGSISLANGANFTTTGNFSNTGILVIGPASVFTVAGNYTQGASGTLDVQLGDVPANGQFGQLAVTGQANLGGTLQVDLVNGYTPNSGDSFTILVFGTRSGDFAPLNLPAGAVWDPNGGTVSF